MLPRSFYFLRHGETDWNKSGRLQGHTDIPLNETGREQARSAVALMRTLPIDRIVTSTLVRAHETARLVNEGLQKPIVVDALLRERNFGVFEAQEIAKLEPLRAELRDRGLPIEENGYPCPPEAETYADFRARTLTSITTHLEAFAGENVLFVAHGGLYRVLKQCLFGNVDQSPNVQPFHFEKAEERWILHVLRA